MARNYLRNIAAEAMPDELAMPQNWLRNESTGKVYDLGPSLGASGNKVALDFARGKYQTQDGRVGYYAKDDPNKVYNTQGQLLTEFTPAFDMGQEKARQTKLAILKDEEELNFLRLRNAATQAMNGKPKPPANMQYGEDGNLQVIPGSTPDIARQKMEAKNAADYAKALGDQKEHAMATEAMLHNIEKLIGPETESGQMKLHPGFAAAIGPVDQKFPTLMPDTSTAESYTKGLKAQAANAGLARVRANGSPGAITEKEWPILENVFANLDPSMSQEEFAKQLQYVRQIIKISRQNVKQSFQDRFKREAPEVDLSAAGAMPASGLDPQTESLVNFYTQGR